MRRIAPLFVLALLALALAAIPAMPAMAQGETPTPTPLPVTQQGGPPVEPPIDSFCWGRMSAPWDSLTELPLSNPCGDGWLYQMTHPFWAGCSGVPGDPLCTTRIAYITWEEALSEIRSQGYWAGSLWAIPPRRAVAGEIFSQPFSGGAAAQFGSRVPTGQQVVAPVGPASLEEARELYCAQGAVEFTYGGATYRCPGVDESQPAMSEESLAAAVASAVGKLEIPSAPSASEIAEAVAYRVPGVPTQVYLIGGLLLLTVIVLGLALVRQSRRAAPAAPAAKKKSETRKTGGVSSG